MQNIFLLFFVVVVAAGCGKSIPAPEARFDYAEEIASEDILFKSNVYQTAKYKIFAYETPLNEASTQSVHIYIEGDGLAWTSPTTISNDPTPLNPLGLKLAVQDSFPFKIYLARPCQYVSSSECTKSSWTDHRFSMASINSYHEVLDQIQKEYGPVSFILFGYSGGGTVAALLSASRDDVATLITVAGNLDIDFWARKHSLSPLSGSLNPADYSSSLERVVQTHLIGGQDKIIDKSVFQSYQENFVNKENLRYEIFHSFDHSCCWEQEWKSILKKLMGRQES